MSSAGIIFTLAKVIEGNSKISFSVSLGGIVLLVFLIIIINYKKQLMDKIKKSILMMKLFYKSLRNLKYLHRLDELFKNKEEKTMNKKGVVNWLLFLILFIVFIIILIVIFQNK